MKFRICYLAMRIELKNKILSTKSTLCKQTLLPTTRNFRKAPTQGLPRASAFLLQLKDPQLWHGRLGHPAFQIVNKVLELCNFPTFKESRF